jgi:[acyl-carrier-protein] S-malonyltransferase
MFIFDRLSRQSQKLLGTEGIEARVIDIRWLSPLATHTRGDNASGLIFAATLGDFLSIELGGMLVLAGNEVGLSAFEQVVEPIQQRFPMRLGNHAAFHTPLMAPVAAEGRKQLPVDLFGAPALPLVDGRGAIWWPGATDIDALYAYTLGAQVTERYDFTRAITVAAREFAPDLFIIAGPGTTLGSAVIQSLISAEWRGLQKRGDFQAVQDDGAILISMGMPQQRVFVLSNA